MADAVTKERFEQMGGRDMLVRVNKSFYDKMYAHPWLSKYFEHVEQEYIEMQQTNFMQATLGGDNIYGGKTPVFAHTRIKITEELFVEREKLLKEALEEVGASQPLVNAWLNLDVKFKPAIIKKSEQMEKSSPFGPLMDFPKP